MFVILQILVLCVCLANGVYGQVRYSIPEEMVKGSFVGNIAQDLGLDIQRMKSGRARVFTEHGREYIGLNNDKGTLVVRERIDREEICGPVSPCSLHFQIILENPMELHRGAVAVPGGEASRKDALDGTAIKSAEDAGAHSKPLQSPEQEEALLRLLHCLSV
uniref:Cadherin N-terminal domain-containing protein n=1 Tax=Paramormyrops kingsleyae TaxID=1676925 RepID=A0A3B3T623_9TELE